MFVEDNILLKISEGDQCIRCKIKIKENNIPTKTNECNFFESVQFTFGPALKKMHIGMESNIQAKNISEK